MRGDVAARKEYLVEGSNHLDVASGVCDVVGGQGAGGAPNLIVDLNTVY